MEGRLSQQARRGGLAQTREWISEDWVRELVKYLAPAALATAGVEVETVLGRYELDLLIQLGTLRVGFTRDSASRRVLEGVWRDAALLGPGGAHVIYHVRPVDLEHHLEDVIYAVYRCDERLFSNRGGTLVERLASPAIQAAQFPREEMSVYYPQAYDEELDADPSGDPDDVIVEALPRETEEALYLVRRTQAGLRKWYEYVRRSGLRTPEAVMQRFAADELAESDLDE